MPLPLIYGSLIGLAQLLATLVVFALGKHQSAEGLASAQMPESLIGFILLMIVVSLAHRSAKTKFAQGAALPFGTAAKFALATGLVGGLATGLGQFIYLQFLNPNLGALRLEIWLLTQKSAIDQLTPEAKAELIQNHAYFNSPTFFSIVHGVNTFLFATLMGIAFALIFRAAVRRDDKAALAK